MSVFRYLVPSIPDCTHHRLVSQFGGSVREEASRASEQLLRMIANFKEGQIALAIRFLFEPLQGVAPQKRLSIQLAIKTGSGISAGTVHQLIDAGPLAEFYDCRQTEGLEDRCALDHPFDSICELVRQEEGIEPLVSREDNDRVPSLYYALYPFECREDNDYLALDRLLSKMQEPCAVEILVQPVDHTADLAAHYGYITHLMSVNQYGDDLLADHLAPRPWSDDQPGGRILTSARKKDPIADEILREHEELHRKLRQPQLLFHIKTLSARPEHALLLASTIAESGLASGKYRILSYARTEGDENDGEKVRRSLADSCNLNVSSDAMYPRVWNRELPKNWRGMSRLCRLATVDELKGLVRLPVGGYGSPRCIRKFTDPEPWRAEDTILIGDDLESQSPMPRSSPDDLSDLFQCESPENLELRLPVAALTKHMFVAGVPGSGKTTALFNILVQLSRHGIPFLVIEPAKTEYRILKTLRDHPDESVRAMAERLRVYTPGRDTISPLRFNPLEYPGGISLDEHIGQVLACFEAAMPLGGPLQALIAEAVEAVYEEREEGDFPQMAGLVEAAQRIMHEKQYEGEIRSNLQAAIEVRLGLLTRRAVGRIFQCHRSIPATADLLEHPTIIEMDYLTQDHACLLTLFLLAAVREHIRIDPRRHDGHLHHVTVIEEAHNIVGRAGQAQASEDFADPKAFAAQYVSRMLAELRALGEGIVIADQLPSAVAPEVVKNTSTKLAHRLVSNDDREDLGGAMLLGATEIEELARLSPGEAYFYSEGLYKPRRVGCLNANSYLCLAETPIGSAIERYLQGNVWFENAHEARLLMALDIFEEHFPKLLDAIHDASTKAQAIIPHEINLAVDIEDPVQRRQELSHLYVALASIRDELRDRVEDGFIRRTWGPQVRDIELGRELFESVRRRSDQVIGRYNEQVVPALDQVVDAVQDTLDQIRPILV
ncbi:MAG: hypothetical protein AMXMBFR13_06170 [Phycisphaerae bacterium]